MLKKMNIERVIVVTRPTELDMLVERFSTVPQARFYIEQSGQDFERIVKANTAYKEALKTVNQAIPASLKKQVMQRDMVFCFTFNPTDVIVVVGQDGLVSNTAKYLDGQPIIGVNPSPDLFDGVLLPFEPKDVTEILKKIIDGRAPIEKVTLAEATTRDGQKLLAFNDFFIGAKSHVSARYDIQHGDIQEVQSSSGIIVATGAGSTGWLKSVYKGALNIAKAFGGGLMIEPSKSFMPWDTEELVFVVREPYPSKSTSAELGYGRITEASPLLVNSRMATEGVIFSDGMEEDYITFNTGNSVTIRPAKKIANLVAPTIWKDTFGRTLKGSYA